MTRHHQAHCLPPRTGFTLVELLFVIAAIGILIGMLLPFVGRNVRGASRRTDCSNRIRQIALASHNYYDAHKRLPPAMGDLTSTPSDSGRYGDGRTSGLVLLLPFMEMHSHWDEISSKSSYNGVDYPPFGPAEPDPNYGPWAEEIPHFICPSATNSYREFGRTSYAFSIGDVARDIHQPAAARGAFACQIATDLDVPDGTSNTIAFCEIKLAARRDSVTHVAIGQGVSLLEEPTILLDLQSAQSRQKYLDSVNVATMQRGGCWGDGSAGPGLVNTILPPNSPSGAVGTSLPSDGIYSGGTWHNEMTNVAMLDGSVQIIYRGIDTGQSPTLSVDQLKDSAGIPSPHGVWGQLGSANGSEEINKDELWDY